MDSGEDEGKGKGFCWFVDSQISAMFSWEGSVSQGEQMPVRTGPFHSQGTKRREDRLKRSLSLRTLLLKGFPGSHQCPPKDRRFNTQNFIPNGNKETRAERGGREAQFTGPTMKSANTEISRKASWDQPR